MPTRRELPEDFDGDPEEALEIMGPFDEWFDPAEGKAVFQALANVIKQKPKLAKTLEDPEAVVYELEELARVLAIAEKRKTKFHLEMS